MLNSSMKSNVYVPSEVERQLIPLKTMELLLNRYVGSKKIFGGTDGLGQD